MLTEGADVADGHGEGGQHGQCGAPDVGVRGEADDGDEDEAGEADRLADDRQVGGDGQRGSDVGLGDPEVEGDGCRLEGEADQGEDHAGLGQGVQSAVDVLDAVGDLGEVEGSGRRVHEADAQEADGGRGDGRQEELQGRLGGPAVAVPDADQGEGGQGGDLQGDDEGGEVAGGGQQGGSRGGGQQQEPELAFGKSPARVLQGGDRQQGRQQRSPEHQELDDEGEAVCRVAAHACVAGQAEGGAVAVQEGQEEGRGGGESRYRQPAEERFAGVADEKVGDEDDEGHDRREGGRRDGQPVDGLDHRLGQGLEHGLGQGAHRVPPARSCCTAGSVSPRRAFGHRPATTVRATSGAQAANS